MTVQDRVRWDRYYQFLDEQYPAPDPILFQFTPSVLEMGRKREFRALDLAAGVGQNGLWLATQGYTTDLLDISREALRRAQEQAARGKVRRGVLHLALRSPWGLAWRRVQRELPWAATVFPNLQHAALRALPTQSQRRREAGLRNVRRLGEVPALDQTREARRSGDVGALADHLKVAVRPDDERFEPAELGVGAAPLASASRRKIRPSG